MESGSNVSVGKEVSPKDVGVENPLERKSLARARVKRPYEWEDMIARLVNMGSSKVVRPLVAAGLVALGGAGFTNDAQAQQMQNQWANQPTTWGQVGNQPVRVSNGQVLARVIGAGVANRALADSDIPARVGVAPDGSLTAQINLNAQPRLRVNVSPEAIDVMNQLGLAYEPMPFYIANTRDPSQRINIGPNTLSVDIQKAGGTNVFLSVVYNEGGRRILQKFLIGVDQSGNMMTAELARQAI
jgi:hypothetical protein